jgi:hypothetical protein
MAPFKEARVIRPGTIPSTTTNPKRDSYESRSRIRARLADDRYVINP